MPEQSPAAPQHVHHADLNYQMPAEAAPELRLVESPNGDGHLGAYRDGYTVKHFPGKRVHQRLHLFDDLDSFADYLNRHANPREVAEILLAPDGRVTAALAPDETNGDLIACDLVMHPRFAAWHRWLQPKAVRGELTIATERLTQRDFFALLRAGQHDIVPGIDVTEGPQQPAAPPVGQMLLAAVRSIKVTKGATQQIDMDERGFTRFTSSDGRRDISSVLPPYFWLDVPVYDGVYPPALRIRVDAAAEPGNFGPGPISAEPLDAVPFEPHTLRTYKLEVLLWVEEALDGGIVFSLQAPSLDLVMRQARRDAAAYLQSLLEDDLMVGLGSLELSNVPAAGIFPDGNPPSMYYRPHQPPRGAQAR